MFPATRHAARAGAGWLVNITNDGWFGASAGPRQHFLRPRAGRPGSVIRCANTGISALCLPDGNLVGELGLETRGTATVRAARGVPTIFARTQPLQDATWVTCAAFLSLWGAARVRRGKKTAEKRTRP